MSIEHQNEQVLVAARRFSVLLGAGLSYDYLAEQNPTESDLAVNVTKHRTACVVGVGFVVDVKWDNTCDCVVFALNYIGQPERYKIKVLNCVLAREVVREYLAFRYLGLCAIRHFSMGGLEPKQVVKPVSETTSVADYSALGDINLPEGANPKAITFWRYMAANKAHFKAKLLGAVDPFSMFQVVESSVNKYWLMTLSREVSSVTLRETMRDLGVKLDVVV